MPESPDTATPDPLPATAVVMVVWRTPSSCSRSSRATSPGYDEAVRAPPVHTATPGAPSRCTTCCPDTAWVSRPARPSAGRTRPRPRRRGWPGSRRRRAPGSPRPRRPRGRSRSCRRRPSSGARCTGTPRVDRGVGRAGSRADRPPRARSRSGDLALDQETAHPDAPSVMFRRRPAPDVITVAPGGVRRHREHSPMFRLQVTPRPRTSRP